MKKVHEEWYPEMRERDADQRSMRERAVALMKAWLESSAGNDNVALKVEYGFAIDEATNKNTYSVIAISMNGSMPIQFTPKELVWSVRRMRGFFANMMLQEPDDELINNPEYQEVMESFFCTLETSAEEAESMSPGKTH